MDRKKTYRYKYVDSLISSLDSNNEINISEKVEANIPYIFLRKCFSLFWKELEEIAEKRVQQVHTKYTYKKKRLNIVFSYSADEKLILVFLENEMESI
jgi:hypothetical protein